MESLSLSEQDPFENDLKWAQQLPKVELHLHMEGAIPLTTLWALVEKYGGSSEIQDIQTLQQKFVFRDFSHFIETWIWKNQFIREYEDFTLIAAAVAQDLVQQNVHYAEVFYSPIEHTEDGLSIGGITRAIREGLDLVPGIEVALIPDLVRDVGPVLGMWTLEQLRDVREYGVIGIGIGGSEQHYPPEPWAEVYERARSYDFHTTAHAGEAESAASIWGVLQSLKVERIGHGIHAIDDPALMDYLATHQIPLEVCPISNVKTAVVKDLVSHPIREMYQRGLLVTVNTDDPQMFGNSLAEEYACLLKYCGFTHTDILHVARNALHASWLPQARKAAYLAQFMQQSAWSAREHSDS